MISIILVVLLFVTYSVFFFNAKTSPKEITYQEFQQMLTEKRIESIELNKQTERLTIKDKEKKQYTTESPQYENFKKEILEQGIDVKTTKPSAWSGILQTLLSLCFYVLLFFFLFRYMNIGTFKKAKVVANIPDTKFSDIAGYSEQKEDLVTYVEYLKNPEKFHKKGATMPKGVLLYGPPGTGKTLFARAVAGEAGVPFFSASGSDFIEMFVGVGAKRIRSLFESAREKAPCIIFIDEIDAIGSKRNALSNSEQTQTINALLTEMDGFQKETGILVLATTNQPDALDPALVRSGRFDSHISIPLPATTEERELIIEVHKKNRTFSEDIDFKELAKQWIGFSGADIENILNEATIISTKKGFDEVTKECIEEAFYKKVLKGHMKKSGQQERDTKELEIVAYHEAGHAVVSTLLGVGEVSKVTILSTTNGAGGITFNIPKKMGLFSMEELENEVKVLYGGRAAEYLLFNKNIKKVTTGAANDIERATKILVDMIGKYGLNKDFHLLNLPNIPRGDGEVAEEVKMTSQKLFHETVSLLEEHYPLLQKVTERLLEKETIEAEELQEIVKNYQETKMTKEVA